ncbi:MAG: hypothetical protein HZA58_03860 [Acidimicrobiia bacterium]|nr:hypothetical protein [Acidimicrobiia bacterium]
MHVPRHAPGTAFLLAVALAVAACGDDAGTTTVPAGTSSSAAQSTTTSPGTTTTSGPETIQPGGEVVIGVLEEPLSLNWFAGGAESPVVGLIGAAAWAGMADVDGVTRQFVPDVVVTLPTVANGGLVLNEDGTESVRLDIAPEAVWADGTPISGEDFRFTYETVMRPDVLVDKTGYDLIDPASLVVGEKSFEFRLVRPSLAVESLFPVLLPAHVVGDVDVMSGSWDEDMWVSGGPFELEEWSRGEFITLVRNPNYWKVDATGQPLPYLDRVVFRFVPDVDTLVAEFEARRLDVITPGWDPALLDRLSLLDGVFVDVAGSGQWEHLTFQFGDGRFVRNPGSYNEHLEYRLAIAHAIDRQGLVDAVLGGWGEPLDSYVEAFTPAWSQGAWGRYDYDPAKARDYLAALCQKDGVDCAANPPTAVLVTTEQRGDLALALEPMFSAVGIEYRSELEPRVIFLGETIEFGTFDLGDWTWVGRPGLRELAALHRVWDPEQAPPVGTNYYRFGSAGYQGEGDLVDYQEGPSSLVNEQTGRMAAIYDLLGTTFDEREVLALVAEAETILAEQLAFIPLYELPDAGVVWADEIGGYRHQPRDDTWNLATWHRSDG